LAWFTLSSALVPFSTHGGPLKLEGGALPNDIQVISVKFTWFAGSQGSFFQQDELYGPPIIAGILFVAVLVNFIVQGEPFAMLYDPKLTLRTAIHRGEGVHTPKNPWLASYLGLFVTLKDH
jgi:hypothetical protein